MEYRQLGESQVKVSRIIFGAWAVGGWMWGGADEDDAIAAIQASVEGGASSIDTAPVYGYGRSEEIVAKAIKGKRDKVQILTKYGLRWDAKEGEHFFDWEDEESGAKSIYRNARKESIIKECENSLKRLQTDYIDLYQCHWRDNSTDLDETMEAMNILLAQGKIRAAGVSNFSLAEIKEARKLCPLASDQPPFSMVNRGIENDILPYCLDNNIGVIVYSPLQRGLLTGKFKADSQFKPGDHRARQIHFQAENIKRVNTFLEKLRPLADVRQATISQIVIAWTLQRPGITAAIVGARNAEQAKQNLQTQNINLNADEILLINEHLKSLDLISAGV